MIEDIWNGNYQPNIYEPDSVEQSLVEQLDAVTERVYAKHPDDSDIQSLIEVSSKLMVQHSGRAFNEGIKFGFYFANEINGRKNNEEKH